MNERSTDGSTLDRRGFVNTCALVFLAPMLGACASLAAHPVQVESGRVRLLLTEHPTLTEPGGVLKILPRGMQDPLYVLALPEGAFAVLSPICTHRGCTVDVQGPRLVCPCHGSTYDREGRVLRGPAERSLSRHDATVVQGVLEIDLRSAL
jgi:Rieske Fe-S protein